MHVAATRHITSIGGHVLQLGINWSSTCLHSCWHGLQQGPAQSAATLRCWRPKNALVDQCARAVSCQQKGQAATAASCQGTKHEQPGARERRKSSASASGSEARSKPVVGAVMQHKQARRLLLLQHPFTCSIANGRQRRATVLHFMAQSHLYCGAW